MKHLLILMRLMLDDGLVQIHLETLMHRSAVSNQVVRWEDRSERRTVTVEQMTRPMDHETVKLQMQASCHVLIHHTSNQDQTPRNRVPTVD